MFSQLKSIVDLIRLGIEDFRKFKTEQERKEIVLGVLKTYFLLKDCVDDAEKMIADAGSDPLARIKAMEPNEALRTIGMWDTILKKQAIRLRILQGYIFGQDHLTVINPKLQGEISEIIGYKMDRAVTLHGIGSGLFFRNIFPLGKTEEEITDLVTLIAGVEGGEILDLQKIAAEVESLKQSLEEYRAIVERLVLDKELLILSSQARQETLFKEME
jgi:hypothetical protein